MDKCYVIKYKHLEENGWVKYVDIVTDKEDVDKFEDFVSNDFESYDIISCEIKDQKKMSADKSLFTNKTEGLYTLKYWSLEPHTVYHPKSISFKSLDKIFEFWNLLLQSNDDNECSYFIFDSITHD